MKLILLCTLLAGTVSAAENHVIRPSPWLSWFQELISNEISQNPRTLSVIDKKNCSYCECGQARQTGNSAGIIGGEDVEHVNQYPWMVQLQRKGSFYCGGSLLNSKYVITAAHCVFGMEKNIITVLLLTHDRRGDAHEPITRMVDEIIVHEKFNVWTVENDIALIRLSEEVEIGGSPNKPSPVCLPEEGESFNGTEGLVIGWGKRANGLSADVLQEVHVPIISNEQCNKNYGHLGPITSNMMCAGHPDGGKDSCQGDSGGPLMVINSMSHHLVGIVSFGRDCGDKNFPGVYTRVNRYLSWIHKNTVDSCPCSK